MNAAARHELDATATPVDEYGPVRACVVSRPDGYRTAWAHDGGRSKIPFGAVYTTPRDAASASRYLNGRSGAGVAS